jgi:hypothetical protein
MSLLSSLFVWFLAFSGNIEPCDNDNTQSVEESSTEQCQQESENTDGQFWWHRQMSSTEISNGF